MGFLRGDYADTTNVLDRPLVNEVCRYKAD